MIFTYPVTVKHSACYAALSAWHTLYQPKTGRLKDYIAIPKSNRYQSLAYDFGRPLRPADWSSDTYQGNGCCCQKGGIAGHWSYKSYSKTVDQAVLHTNKWLKNILDLQANSANAIEFLEHVKVDLFPNEIYILTPKGKILTLPGQRLSILLMRCIPISGTKPLPHVSTISWCRCVRSSTGDSVEIIHRTRQTQSRVVEFRRVRQGAQCHT